jgi:hypothetical protein
MRKNSLREVIWMIGNSNNELGVFPFLEQQKAASNTHFVQPCGLPLTHHRNLVVQQGPRLQ